MSTAPCVHFSRLPESCPRAKSELFLTAKTPGDDGKQGEEEETAADDGTTELVVKKDAGVLAATGVTGALLGWSFAHSLDLDLDLAGAVSGERREEGGAVLLCKGCVAEGFESVKGRCACCK